MAAATRNDNFYRLSVGEFYRQKSYAYLRGGQSVRGIFFPFFFPPVFYQPIPFTTPGKINEFIMSTIITGRISDTVGGRNRRAAVLRTLVVGCLLLSRVFSGSGAARPKPKQSAHLDPHWNGFKVGIERK